MAAPTVCPRCARPLTEVATRFGNELRCQNDHRWALETESPRWHGQTPMFPWFPTDFGLDTYGRRVPGVVPEATE